MNPPTVLIIIDPLVPAAARARFLQAVTDAAPIARVLSAETPKGVLHHAADAEVIAGLRVTAPMIERAPRLRWVHAFGAGVDQLVSVPGVRDGRIVLTRTVGAFSPIPEHVLALALAFSRRLHVAVRNQLAHRWDRPAAIGWELHGQVMGILGLGQIGQALASRAASLGMRVIGVKRTPEPLPPDHPFYELEHVILTPHVSAASPRVFDQMAAVFAENLRRYIAGEPLLHVVDAARGY